MFSGSIIAYGKLDGKAKKTFVLSALTYINLLMFGSRCSGVSIISYFNTATIGYDMGNLGIICYRIGVWRIVRYAY